MIQPDTQEAQWPGTPMALPESAPARERAPEESGAAFRHRAQEVGLPPRGSTIAIEDWDALFCAIQAQLRQAVGEHLGVTPPTPSHSVELTATLVQAIVLDCVAAMDQLHAALKQERSQRPTG